MGLVADAHSALPPHARHLAGDKDGARERTAWQERGVQGALEHEAALPAGRKLEDVVERPPVPRRHQNDLQRVQMGAAPLRRVRQEIDVA